MQNLLIRLLPAITAFALSACGGGGSDDGATCNSINGPGAQVTSSCLGCTISNPDNAADGDLDSAASAAAIAPASNVSVTIRATAQNGVVYPAGSIAGVFYTPHGNVCDNCAITINTYMNGVLQDTRSGTNNSSGHGSKAAYFTGMETLLPFNAVEIVDSGAAGSLESNALLDVYEICSDGGYE